jgi:hypothetical protein
VELRPLTGPFVHPPDDTRLHMEQQWNDIDRGKPSATLKATHPT